MKYSLNIPPMILIGTQELYFGPLLRKRSKEHSCARPRVCEQWVLTEHDEPPPLPHRNRRVSEISQVPDCLVPEDKAPVMVLEAHSLAFYRRTCQQLRSQGVPCDG